MSWLPDHGAPDFDGCKFFPGAKKTTDFGLALTADNEGLRIHPAIDRAGGKMLYVPFNDCEAELIFDGTYDKSFGSLIRLFPRGADFEMRIAHTYLYELTQEFVAGVKAGFVSRGVPIGPPGNAGLSTGRHTHVEIVSLEEWSVMCDSMLTEDQDITEHHVFEFAKHNRLPFDECMQDFTDQFRRKKIFNVTQNTCRRVDYHTGRECTFYSSWAVFNRL